MGKGWRIVVALALFLIPLVTVLPAERALACECAIPGNAEAAKGRAAAVFAGTVKSIEEVRENRGDSYYAVTLEADESWKGIDRSEVVVYTSWSSCQFDFEAGKRYLLYPYEREGRYEVMNCGRSGEITQANAQVAADLKELGTGTRFDPPEEESKAAGRNTDGANGRIRLWTGMAVAVLAVGAAGIWAFGRRKRGR